MSKAMILSTESRTQSWPSLPLDDWSPTYATLHLWTQIVGKIRLAQSPWVNHSWHTTLYVTTRKPDFARCISEKRI